MRGNTEIKFTKGVDKKSTLVDNDQQLRKIRLSLACKFMIANRASKNPLTDKAAARMSLQSANELLDLEEELYGGET